MIAMFRGLAESSDSVHGFGSNVSSLVLGKRFVRPPTFVRDQCQRVALEPGDTKNTFSQLDSLGLTPRVPQYSDTSLPCNLSRRPSRTGLSCTSATESRSTFQHEHNFLVAKSDHVPVYLPPTVVNAPCWRIRMPLCTACSHSPAYISLQVALVPAADVKFASIPSPHNPLP